MDGRTILSAVGAGLTTFLLVSVAVIEVLDFEFSPLVGLPIGLMVGVGVTVGVFVTYSGRSAPFGVQSLPSRDSGTPC